MLLSGFFTGVAASARSTCSSSGQCLKKGDEVALLAIAQSQRVEFFFEIQIGPPPFIVEADNLGQRTGAAIVKIWSGYSHIAQARRPVRADLEEE